MAYGYLYLAVLAVASFAIYGGMLILPANSGHYGYADLPPMDKGGNAIRCWTCSSDLEPHCGDPFNHTSPTFNLHHSLTDCGSQSSPNYQLYTSKSVCKKAVKTERGRTVISRSCEWLRSRDDTVGECSPGTFNTPSYSKVEFCETCDTEGCNGAMGIATSSIWKAIVPLCIALFMRY